MSSELRIRRLIRSIILEQDTQAGLKFDPANPNLARTSTGDVVRITDYAALRDAMKGVKFTGKLPSSLGGDSEEESEEGSSGFGRSLPDGIIITSNFGDPRNYRSGTHDGVDFAGQNISGKDVVAALSGEIVKFENRSPKVGYGNFVLIKHDDPAVFSTLYGHLADVTKTSGRVKAGDKIGTVGNTGYTEGPSGYHLHFELRNNSNKPENPIGNPVLDGAVFPVKMQ